MAERVASGAEPRESAAGEEAVCVQPHGFLLVLSLDWIVLRASQNIDRFLGESHVTLIDEPLSRFVQAQALHDLRNFFSRLSGSVDCARAYRVRLTDAPQRFDIVFQVSGGRVLLEGVPTLDHGLGEAIGSVAGLVDGLAETRGPLLEAAARRARALTGYDRAIVATAGAEQAESCRGSFAASHPAHVQRGTKAHIIADVNAEPVPIFPRKAGDRSVEAALLRAPTSAERAAFLEHGIAATMTVPMRRRGELVGAIHCDHRTARRCDVETHAAAELFGRILAAELEVERLNRHSSHTSGDPQPVGSQGA